MKGSMALQILPEMADDQKVIEVVDEVIKYMKSSGLNCYVGPFETTIEGDIDQIIDILKECIHIAARENKKGVFAYVKFEYRPENDILSIEKKVTKHHQQ